MAIVYLFDEEGELAFSGELGVSDPIFSHVEAIGSKEKRLGSSHPISDQLDAIRSEIEWRQTAQDNQKR